MTRKLVDPQGRVPARVLRKALEAVNAIRQAYGAKPLKKLPRGEPVSSCNCPVARALKPVGVNSVHDSGIRITRTEPVFGAATDIRLRVGDPAMNEQSQVHMRDIQRFILAFDTDPND